MKKTLKVLALIFALLIMVVGLTGCGDKEETAQEDNTDKLVATQTFDDEEASYEERIEVVFKEDKIDSVEITTTYADEETAEEMKSSIDSTLALVEALGGEEASMYKNIEIEQSGNKIIMKTNAEVFVSMYAGATEDMTKDELKVQLESEGYNVE